LGGCHLSRRGTGILNKAFAFRIDVIIDVNLLDALPAYWTGYHGDRLIVIQGKSFRGFLENFSVKV
jgi:hypothetical protein